MLGGRGICPPLDGLVLLRGVVEHSAAVLRADIAALRKGSRVVRRILVRLEEAHLAVQGSGVVDVPEKLHEVLEGHTCSVVVHFHCLGMTRLPCRYMFVGWICEVSASISYGGAEDPRNPLKRQLHTPEASCRKYGALLIGRAQTEAHERDQQETPHDGKLLQKINPGWEINPGCGRPSPNGKAVRMRAR